MNYDVVRVVDGREQRDIEPEAATLGVTVVDARRARGDPAAGGAGADLAAVVASQGHYDEEALEAILRCGVPYVGLVASRKRGAAVRALLEERGVPGVATIRNPAGLDLGARTPPEVALSILAEIVQARPSGARVAATTPAAASPCAAPASAGDRRRSGVRHERDRRLGAPHGGGRRRHVLLLLRELPREVRRRTRRRTWPTHDGRCGHPRPLPRARLHRRRGVRHRAADHARAREAAAHRGAGRRRQDREREGARRGARHAS